MLKKEAVPSVFFWDYSIKMTKEDPTQKKTYGRSKHILFTYL